MDEVSAQPPLGSAYDRAAGHSNELLAQTGRGTPAGELLRRYWHPIGVTADAGDRPRLIRALGEDLILFRDGAGKAGLLYPRCAHRGTTLFYGKVEARGLRCCYHGWLFDAEGRCLEQPCEPEGGVQRHLIRQPWYPVEERYGLIWAYLGPPAKKPVLPRYECLDALGPDEFVLADDTSLGSGGPVVVPCNWFQHYENVVDPFHVPVLHGSFSGAQFTAIMASLPDVTFETTERGVKVTSLRPQPDGRTFRRVTEAALPTLRVVPNPRVAQWARVDSIGWVLPIDDTHFRIYTAGRVTEPDAFVNMRSKQNGKFWQDLTPEERQRFPGDYEAQTGQGAVTLHSEEHLAGSDKGIALLRRLFLAQIRAVENGRNPAGTAFAESEASVTFDAGNFLVDAR